MKDHSPRGHGWTVVLRRQPVRIVEGQPVGGYTDTYELVCYLCGDDPYADYRDVTSWFQQVRGPYRFVVGIEAYSTHVKQYHPAPVNAGPPARLIRGG